MKFTLSVALVAIAFLVRGVNLGAQAPKPAAKPAGRTYLHLGADPAEKDRQPGPGEEIVVIDADICDSGWTTGSGKKVAGCYPANTALIRDKLTGVVAAAFVCGNKPSDRHIVTGKVVAAKDAPIPVPPSVFSGKLEITGIPTETTQHVDGDVNVHHDGDINVHHDGTVTIIHKTEPPPAKVDGDGFPLKKTLIWSGVIVGSIFGTKAVWDHYHHPDASNNQGPPGVVTKPPTGGPSVSTGKSLKLSFAFKF